MEFDNYFLKCYKESDEKGILLFLLLVTCLTGGASIIFLFDRDLFLILDIWKLIFLSFCVMLPIIVTNMTASFILNIIVRKWKNENANPFIELVFAPTYISWVTIFSVFMKKFLCASYHFLSIETIVIVFLIAVLYIVISLIIYFFLHQWPNLTFKSIRFFKATDDSIGTNDLRNKAYSSWYSIISFFGTFLSLLFIKIDNYATYLVLIVIITIVLCFAGIEIYRYLFNKGVNINKIIIFTCKISEKINYLSYPILIITLLVSLR